VNVVIIGNNKYNTYVSEYFSHMGYTPDIISDVYDIRSLSGEAGDFTVGTKSSNLKADFIVLTEQPKAEPVKINGLVTISLYNEQNSPEHVTGIGEPIVFLLDYICQSPMAATIQALSKAIEFASKKRHVFYLAKFIRTAGRGIEELYKDARESGVTFIKYEGLELSADPYEGIFNVFATDGVFSQEINTKTIYSDGGSEVGDAFSYIVKKLNLTSGKHGYITEDMYFLSPALTSRRGVYHLTRDLAAERLDEGLVYIYSHFKSGIWEKPSHGSAVIDGKKCIFCYNCYRVCPHAALEPDSNVCQMRCLTAACAGCGACAGLCPAGAIVLETDALRTVDGTKPCKALILYCENSGAIDTLEGIDSIPLPCGGLTDLSRLLDGLNFYDKVLAVVCPDDACRHFDGNKRACSQVKRLQDILEAAGLSPEKAGVIQASQAMPNVFKDELERLLNDNS